jgi:hypothetical protein
VETHVEYLGKSQTTPMELIMQTGQIAWNQI